MINEAIRLLEQFAFHNSSDAEHRKRACPIIFFKRVQVGALLKGMLNLMGLVLLQLLKKSFNLIEKLIQIL